MWNNPAASKMCPESKHGVAAVHHTPLLSLQDVDDLPCICGGYPKNNAYVGSP